MKWLLATPPTPASQSIAGRTSAGSAAQYSSVRLQVDRIAASGLPLGRATRSRNPCRVGANCSSVNAKRPRKSSGAVVWFRPRAKTLMGRL